MTFTSPPFLPAKMSKSEPCCIWCNIGSEHNPRALKTIRDLIHEEMADRRSQRDGDVQCISLGRCECGVQQAEGWQMNCWEHWLSGRGILFNCIPFACCFVCTNFPRASSFYVQKALSRVGWISKRCSSLLSNHSPHSHQKSPFLSISKRKCEWDLPWRAQVREGEQYQKHLENEDMENGHEQFPEMSQEIIALFNASHFCQTIFVPALNVSISVCAANLVIFNSRH